MQHDRRRRVLEHIDRNSPGTMSAYRGERPPETTPDEIDLGDDPPTELVDALARTGYSRPETELLPADRFSDEPAADWQRKLIHSPTRADCLRDRSRAVRFRLLSSCAGWRRPPTSEEFYAAVRASAPSERQTAILDTWAAEAEWHELLTAWAEHAYTLRELAAALHRAGLARCHAADALNRWAS